jgi:molybdate transport system ATP-binding protein
MAEMRHRIGTLAIDVAFSLTQSWTVLFGPSGSGKSTILRAIAGLVQPDSGKIARISSPTRDRTEHDTAFFLFDSGAKKCLPAYTRGIPLAPQASSLFPHMSVAENVAYGRRRQSEASNSEIAAALAVFCIAHLAGKGAAELSGGEAQRVNLARAALAAERDGVLLLDEPFTGLDLALRSELMLGLQTWAVERNLCVLSVTHDVAEAFQLGAEVIKIADGKVVQQGPVEVVLAEERARLLRQLDSRDEQTVSTEPFLSG